VKVVIEKFTHGIFGFSFEYGIRKKNKDFKLNLSESNFWITALLKRKERKT